MSPLLIYNNESRTPKKSQKLLSYKFWIALLSVNYVFIDFIRRFFEGDKNLLILLDLNILIIFLLFFYKSGIRLRKTAKTSALLFFLIIYICLVVIQVTNYSLPDLVTTFAGLRSYLLAIPFLWISYYVVCQEGVVTIVNFSKVLLYLSIVSIGYGCFMFFSDSSIYSGVLLSLTTPMGHSAHSFGDSTQELTSSFFASSSKFSGFLLVSYLVIWGCMKLQDRTVLPLFVLFLLGFIVSGNRAGFSLFLLFNIFAILCFHRKIFFLSVFVSVLTGVLGSMLLGSAFIYKEKIEGDGYLNRLNYMVENIEEYSARLNQAFPLSQLNLNNEELLFGVGLGKYGQESALSSAIAPIGEDLFQAFFHESSYHSEDSGFVKIAIELGLLGLLVFLLFASMFVVFSFLIIVRAIKSRDYLAFSVGFFTVFWLLLFLKGHPVISDIVMSSFLYMSIGFILAVLQVAGGINNVSVLKLDMVSGNRYPSNPVRY